MAIDEAHCVSEWGHDFRTSYLNLGRIARAYCSTGGKRKTPPLVALTGTAGKIVLKDIQRELGITAFDALITPRSFDRRELRFTILHSQSEEKEQKVKDFLESLPGIFDIEFDRFFQPAGPQSHAGLVFCPHINGSYGVVDQARMLENLLQTKVDFYCGSAPKGFPPDEWRNKKRINASDFKRNSTTLMACTNAFGMGIDKSNIRYTLHLGLPSSIEAFYQEAGRAGRDHQKAECAILLSDDNPTRSQFLLGSGTPLPEITRIVDETSWKDSDDVLRALFFHVHAFRGEEAEVADIAVAIDILGEARTRRQGIVSWRDPRWQSSNPRGGSPDGQDQEQGRVEKALHRLVLLGVIQDYTLNYAGGEFAVHMAGASQEEIAQALGQYAGAYDRRRGKMMLAEVLAARQPDHRLFVLEAAARLVKFIYQHIELARRRALAEMLQAVIGSKTGEDLRKRILDYLQQTEWDGRLEAVRASSKGGMDVLAAILEEMSAPNDPQLLRAAAGRQLASYPDVPGLLVLRAVAEVLSPDANPRAAWEDMHAALGYATETYQIAAEHIAAGLGQVVDHATSKDGAADVLVEAIVGSANTGRPLMRALLTQLPEKHNPAARWLLNHLATRVATLID